MMPDRIRAFVALRLAAEVARTVAELIESLRPPRDSRGSIHSAMSGDVRGSIRWVRRANLHLTLRFLGDRVEAATLELLDRALSRVAAATAGFNIGVRGTGAFPNMTRPRVVWVGLESPELIALADQVERSASEAGLPSERRAYSPHLTIGRLRDLAGWSELRPAIEAAAARDFGQSLVQSVVLYRSRLGADSATYEELARYPFGGGP